SPDHGGTVRARSLSELISNDIKISIIDKRRTGINQTEVMGLIGDVKDQNAVIIDDIIDTGGTIIKAAETFSTAGLFSKMSKPLLKIPWVAAITIFL
ncbi:phosphoribosyltransferase family protein, partial [Mycoplasmopsis bovis]|uniref:phosphoribosyltransferase family protein n=1 Tax=Mycoplasmopsis bovis TaxID=28903 RepID=UPI003D2B5673